MNRKARKQRYKLCTTRKVHKKDMSDKDIKSNSEEAVTASGQSHRALVPGI